MRNRIKEIEKEIGFCENRLEKKRRLQRRSESLRHDIEVLDDLLKGFAGCEGLPKAEPEGPEVPRHRRRLLAIGLLDALREERDILTWEAESVRSILKGLTGLRSRISHIEKERARLLLSLQETHSTPPEREAAVVAAREWDTCFEDIQDIEDAVFSLKRNLDYLRSCRQHLVAAKDELDPGTPAASQFDIYRHSSVGRAQEMALGADRNLKEAQRELTCMSRSALRTGALRPIFLDLSGSLFDDILEGRDFERSRKLIEAALAVNARAVERLVRKLSLLSRKRDEIDRELSRQRSARSSSHDQHLPVH